ncbi:uncharacterized protein RHIMIDRAFT_262440 [Rhizopus microsporus ATCC 52813]|uniref:Uncharacterized protein n=1 Tax=Rhizopus microsporus ATCC 52813 TaxID=1340429 RepID=A0A2G4SN22_RHIZD|nr:uncharacterized protein RHIMIDRAFT_262440 [Rhizopus microsporus ATCC 52813]PHZ09776.1 hypothetical protein RHIMIDRAFT_262440 [Rhizopus microsporus ATCC 52813]
MKRENRKATLLYLDETLLDEEEKKHWVGIYANTHVHMGNRNSGRAESFHSGLKRVLGYQSAAKLNLTRMHNYYQKKREDR